jgi:hypothetical protein
MWGAGWGSDQSSTHQGCPVTIQTVLNVTQTALVIDTAGHLLGAREPYLYDDGTISPANFAILQAHLNNGRLRLLTGGVTIPAPAQGASFVSVKIQGQNLVFTDSLGAVTSVSVPGGNVDLTGYATTTAVQNAVADKVTSTQATSIAQTAATAAVADKVTTAQATTLATNAATTAVAGTIAPIQAAVNDARRGIVDGAYGLSIGIHDAAPNTIYATNNPAAEYDPITNRTYIAYSSSEFRALAVRYFDHTTGVFSPKVFADEYHIPNADDNHGGPSLTIDQKNRRIVITHGIHNDKLCFVRSSSMDIASATWTVVRPNINGSYTMVAYDSVSQNIYATFRRGVTHDTTKTDTHEYGGIAKSTDGGATWATITTALINTKLVFPGDAASDYYCSDFDAFNGKLYISFAIAHGSGHDGPRNGVHVCYFDPATETLKAVDGQSINLNGSTADDFTKIRLMSQDYTYPIKTAVNPTGKVMTTWNAFDSTINGANGYVRNYAALFDGTQWTIIDTQVYSNYVYNGLGVNWRNNAWELVAIRNLSNDNVVATTSQRDTLPQATAGGDLIHLTSADGLVWTVDTTWDAERFETPVTYLQCVRNAQPGLIFLAQGVSYGAIADITGDTGTGNIGSYNVANWQSTVYFGYATTNLPAVQNIQKRGDTQYTHNPIYAITGASAVTPPTTMTALPVSPPLPRGTQKVKLKVQVTANGAAGRIVISFRAGGSYRSSDAQLTFHGSFTYTQIADVEVPVGPSGNIEWTSVLDSGVTCTAQLFIRAHTVGSQRLLSKTPVAAIAKKGNVVVTIPTTNPSPSDTTAPTAPTTVTATAGDASATITASGATDATGVTGYKAYTASTGGTAVASGASPLTVTGLTNGTAVTFYVSAIDAAGNESTRTASNAVTPVAATTAPTTAPTLALGTATVTTQPATSTQPSGATAVQYEHKATSGSTWTVDTTSGGTSYTYTGLTAATSYDYRSAGINASGVGPYSTVITASTAASGAATAFTDFDSTTTGIADATPPGNGWTDVSGKFQRISNQLAPANLTTTAGNYWLLRQIPSTKHSSQFNVAARMSTTTPAWAMPVIHSDATGANCYYGSFDFSANNWMIYKVTAGTAAALATVAGTAPTTPSVLSLSDPNTDGNLVLSLNGSSVATAADTTFVSQTYAGIRFRNPSTTSASVTAANNLRLDTVKIGA